MGAVQIDGQQGKGPIDKKLELQEGVKLLPFLNNMHTPKMLLEMCSFYIASFSHEIFSIWLTFVSWDISYSKVMAFCQFLTLIRGHRCPKLPV